MERLSFLENEFSHLVGILPSLVKGLKKAIALYQIGDQWYSQELVDNEMLERTVLTDPELVERLKAFCTTRKQYIWLAEDDLPFDPKSASVLQLQLTQETERSTLVLFLEKDETHAKDLLFIYLDPDYNYFGLRKKAHLSNQEKAILANVLWNAVSTIRKQGKSDKELYSGIIEFKKYTENESRDIRSELERERSARGESLLEYCNILLDKWRLKLDIDIRLTNRAYDKIKWEAKSFKQLEYSLEKSIQIAFNLRLNPEDAIVLDDFEITLTDRKVSIDIQEDKPVVGRLEATRNLLDKYEKSAQLVKEAGERVLGKTVGQYCQPSISNAAITDAVKNHRDRIIQLLQMYPDNWLIIRKEFKTITNLLLPPKIIEKKAG